MGAEIIGERIAELRRKEGIKQEILAQYVGVSVQAVSKWENGGVPDIYLLPKIADYFGITIDSLFGREKEDSRDPLDELLCEISKREAEERFKDAFELCWKIEYMLTGKLDELKISDNIAAYEKKISSISQHYSTILTDGGYTMMGIANRLQYFLLVPEIKDTDLALFDGIDYVDFFRYLSDKDLFNACVLLNRYGADFSFVLDFLIKKLNVTNEKAKEIVSFLDKYKMLKRSKIEIEGEMKELYIFVPTASFVALLIFAREMIDRPRDGSCQMRRRNKPYLN